MERDAQQKPWYKEPWPWVAIAIPGLAVIMGITTLVLALKNPDPVMVSDRDYEQISSGLKALPASTTSTEQPENAPARDDGEP
jgi:hypothetical protein